MRRIRISVPWLLGQLGVRKWMAERALHVPEADLPYVAASAGVTPEQWRGMEASLVAMLYDGIEARLP
jgi:hypothetical protein